MYMIVVGVENACVNTHVVGAFWCGVGDVTFVEGAYDGCVVMPYFKVALGAREACADDRTFE